MLPHFRPIPWPKDEEEENNMCGMKERDCRICLMFEKCYPVVKYSDEEDSSWNQRTIAEAQIRGDLCVNNRKKDFDERAKTRPEATFEAIEKAQVGSDIIIYNEHCKIDYIIRVVAKEKEEK